MAFATASGEIIAARFHSPGTVSQSGLSVAPG